MKKSAIALSCLCIWACNNGSDTHVVDASPDRVVGKGGSGSGGETTTGGANATGGRTGTGGVTGTGGASATGGRTGTGGHDGTGGAASGGRTGAGGASGIAGISGTGGRSGTGGGSGTGGRTGSGGNTGGRSGAGTGGATGSGGAMAGSTGSCAAPPEPSPLVGWATVSSNGVTTTTGGGSATPVTVTSLGDLQNAVKGTTAAVIYVKGALAAGTVTVGSNKTIAGLCGAEIHGHVEMSGSVNVIVRNVKLVGYAVGDCSKDPSFDSGEGCSSGQDLITVQNDAHHLWFDHCDISDGTDGNLDITNGANYVTVSWTKFHYTPRTDTVGSDSTGANGHRFSNLVGGSDSKTSDAGKLNVTWHHNWWADNVVERQPRVRFGKNHVFNNLYTSSASSYCVRAGIEAQILIESNVFSGVKDPHEFNNSSDQGTAYITVKDNVYTNVSGTKDTGGGGTPFTDPPYDYTPDATASLQTAVQSGAGPH